MHNITLNKPTISLDKPRAWVSVHVISPGQMDVPIYGQGFRMFLCHLQWCATGPSPSHQQRAQARHTLALTAEAPSAVPGSTQYRTAPQLIPHAARDEHGARSPQQHCGPQTRRSPPRLQGGSSPQPLAIEWVPLGLIAPTASEAEAELGSLRDLSRASLDGSIRFCGGRTRGSMARPLTRPKHDRSSLKHTWSRPSSTPPYSSSLRALSSYSEWSILNHSANRHQAFLMEISPSPAPGPAHRSCGR